jgi:hypothetical protein
VDELIYVDGRGVRKASSAANAYDNGVVLKNRLNVNGIAATTYSGAWATRAGDSSVDRQSYAVKVSGPRGTYFLTWHTLPGPVRSAGGRIEARAIDSDTDEYLICTARSIDWGEDMHEEIKALIG